MTTKKDLQQRVDTWVLGNLITTVDLFKNCVSVPDVRQILSSDLQVPEEAFGQRMRSVADAIRKTFPETHSKAHMVDLTQNARTGHRHYKNLIITPLAQLRLLSIQNPALQEPSPPLPQEPQLSPQLPPHNTEEQHQDENETIPMEDLAGPSTPPPLEVSVLENWLVNNLRYVDIPLHHCLRYEHLVTLILRETSTSRNALAEDLEPLLRKIFPHFNPLPSITRSYEGVNYLINIERYSSFTDLFPTVFPPQSAIRVGSPELSEPPLTKEQQILRVEQAMREMAANCSKQVLIENVMIRATSPRVRIAVATPAPIVEFHPHLEHQALPPVEVAPAQGYQPAEEVNYLQAQVFPVQQLNADEDDDDELLPHQLPQDDAFEVAHPEWNPDDDL